MRSTYGLSHDEFKKAQNSVKTDEILEAADKKVATLGTLHHADRIGNTPAWQNRNKLDKHGKPLYRIGDDVWRQAQGQNNEMQIAHGPWEDTSSNWADYSGGVQLPNGSWLYPTKDGKYIPETDEQGIERIEYEQHREKYDRNQPHPDLADSRNLRDHLKPFTQGTKEYDSQGGSLKGVPDDLRKQLLIQGLDKYRA